MDDGALLDEPLEDLAFLVRSPNRVTVLDAVADEPLDRYDLEDRTGVTRPTLGRILDDFLERGWIQEADRAYETTALGSYVSREVTTVLERFEPVPALGDVAEWLPDEGLAFDLGRLAGATIVRASTANAVAPTAHIVDRIRTADRVRLLSYSVLQDVMDQCWRGVVDGELELESVLDEQTVTTFEDDPHLLEQAREMVETGRMEAYMVAGVPCTVFIVDDLVLLCLSGGQAAPVAVIESADDEIRTWAESVIDEQRHEGYEIRPATFAE